MLSNHEAKDCRFKFKFKCSCGGNHYQFLCGNSNAPKATTTATDKSAKGGAKGGNAGNALTSTASNAVMTFACERALHRAPLKFEKIKAKKDTN